MWEGEVLVLGHFLHQALEVHLLLELVILAGVQADFDLVHDLVAQVVVVDTLAVVQLFFIRIVLIKIGAVLFEGELRLALHLLIHVPSL